MEKRRKNNLSKRNKLKITELRRAAEIFRLPFCFIGTSAKWIKSQHPSYSWREGSRRGDIIGEAYGTGTYSRPKESPLTRLKALRSALPKQVWHCSRLNVPLGDLGEEKGEVRYKKPPSPLPLKKTGLPHRSNPVLYLLTCIIRMLR